MTLFWGMNWADLDRDMAMDVDGYEIPMNVPPKPF